MIPAGMRASAPTVICERTQASCPGVRPPSLDDAGTSASSTRSPEHSRNRTSTISRTSPRDRSVQSLFARISAGGSTRTRSRSSFSAWIWGALSRTRSTTTPSSPRVRRNRRESGEVLGASRDAPSSSAPEPIGEPQPEAFDFLGKNEEPDVGIPCLAKDQGQKPQPFRFGSGLEAHLQLCDGHGIVPEEAGHRAGIGERRRKDGQGRAYPPRGGSRIRRSRGAGQPGRAGPCRPPPGASRSFRSAS